MSDLKINNELGLDYKKAVANFSLREYGKRIALKATDMPNTAEPIKEQGQITAIQLTLFGTQYKPRGFSLAEFGREKSGA